MSRPRRTREGRLAGAVGGSSHGAISEFPFERARFDVRRGVARVDEPRPGPGRRSTGRIRHVELRDPRSYGHVSEEPLLVDREQIPSLVVLTALRHGLAVMSEVPAGLTLPPASPEALSAPSLLLVQASGPGARDQRPALSRFFWPQLAHDSFFGLGRWCSTRELR